MKMLDNKHARATKIYVLQHIILLMYFDLKTIFFLKSIMKVLDTPPLQRWFPYCVLFVRT